jgi:hypothetical protein
MSISAVASAWTWPSSVDPSLTATNSQTASAFQASLAQWEQNGSSGTQATTTSQTQSDQMQSADGMHRHHHRHGVQTDGGQQSGGSPIQTALSSLVTDIADALQVGGSGTASSTSISSAAAAQTAGTTQSVTSNASMHAPANTLVADVAQAMQAYSTNAANSRTSAVVL